MRIGNIANQACFETGCSVYQLKLCQVGNFEIAITVPSLTFTILFLLLLVFDTTYIHISILLYIAILPLYQIKHYYYYY